MTRRQLRHVKDPFVIQGCTMLARKTCLKAVARFLQRRSYDAKLHNQRTLSRPLGNLETLFYEDYKISPGMQLLSCKKNVSEIIVYSALEMLLSRHPMLRMTIEEKGDSRIFVEMDNVQINFTVTESSDWRVLLKNEQMKRYENNGPLWRFVLLQSPENRRKNLLQFVFSIHHSIADFPYCYVILTDMLNTIKDLQNGTCDKHRPKYLFFPAIEDVLMDVDLGSGFRQTVMKTGDGEKHMEEQLDNCNITPVLEAYEYYYKEEIELLLTTPRKVGSCIWKAIDKESTHKYLLKCKTERISNTAGILAASVLSFGQLLHSKGCRDLVRVNFAFIVNLRRYMDKESTFYPGMAASHCPVVVDINLAMNDALENRFWDLARQIKDQMYYAMKNRKPCENLYSDIANNVKNGRKKGKSEYVFSLSNIDDVDGLKANDNFRLLNFQINADVKVDYYPVFLMVSHVVNGSLQLHVSYASTYTSEETAEMFTSQVNDILLNSMEEHS